ncbi:MAG: FMN-binding protein [Bacillota bacterium]|nr:FMN-binding protein [Bacillota bacterium]
MSRRKKVMLTVVLTAVVIGGILGITFLQSLNKYKKTVNDMKIGTLDLNVVKDGEYEGSCDAGLISVDLKVKVKNHRIEQVDLIKHKNGRGKPAEAVIQEVLNKQSLQVDTVSGATNSSKVILKAVEDALNKGKLP